MKNLKLLIHIWGASLTSMLNRVPLLSSSDISFIGDFPLLAPPLAGLAGLRDSQRIVPRNMRGLLLRTMKNLKFSPERAVQRLGMALAVVLLLQGCAKSLEQIEAEFESAKASGNVRQLEKSGRAMMTALDQAPGYVQRGNYVAATLLEAGADLNIAKEIIDEAVRRFQEDGDRYNPQGYTGAGWEKRKSLKLGLFIHTQARIVEAQGQDHWAGIAYAEAARLTMVPSIIADYVRIMVKQGDRETALTISQAWLKIAPNSEAALASVAELYSDFTGRGDGEEYARGLLQSFRAMRQAEVVAQQVDQPAFPFSLRGINGHTYNLDDYKGKVLVLDFWATWCPPCIQAFPKVAEVIGHFAENPDVVFLEISTDADTSLVRPFVKKNGWDDLHIVFDEGARSGYGVPGVPTWVFIDRTGRVRYEITGYNPEVNFQDELIMRIESLL